MEPQGDGRILARSRVLKSPGLRRHPRQPPGLLLAHLQGEQPAAQARSAGLSSLPDRIRHHGRPAPDLLRGGVLKSPPARARTSETRACPVCAGTFESAKTIRQICCSPICRKDAERKRDQARDEDRAWRAQRAK